MARKAIQAVTRETFVGPYDERFGPDHDHIARLFAGPEVEKLESGEREVAKGEERGL